jgi:hypothetical protein
MLIFGYYTWTSTHDNPNKFTLVKYNGNTGKNELAFLNDTRLSRFAVGDYSKLRSVLSNVFNVSFNCVQFRPPVVTNLIPGADYGVGAIDADTNADETNVSESVGAVSESSVAFEPVGATSEPVAAYETNNKRRRKNPVIPVISDYFTRYKKREREDKTGGSKIGGTRRVKLRKKYITRKKNKILKKGTKKHYRKKYKTKRLI